MTKMSGDEAMRAFASGLPAPTLENLPWATPPALAEATGAIAMPVWLYMAPAHR